MHWALEESSVNSWGGGVMDVLHGMGYMIDKH